MPGATYHWSVVASNPAGSFAPEDLTRSFRTRKLGDLNADDSIGATDLGIMLGSWGACAGAGCGADLDGDGNVGSSDLAALLGSWGT
jgi:hypothetical protein